MAKKTNQPSAAATPADARTAPTQAGADYAGLTISRNKHWRYISAFHGTWLQLPPELLETHAHANYLAPRPRQTDPGVLYDLLKIRQLVDEATNLAVRARNGTASSALGGGQGFSGGSLGLMHTTGAQPRLSQERKFRMREMACHKLSQAYRLDEIATSVATMQSSSALDELGGLVLQRTPLNMDAKYVHFFHEKIPSRMMAEHTPLTPLNDILSHQSSHSAAPLRTRALTHIFKDEHQLAVQDLTDALNLCQSEHFKRRGHELSHAGPNGHNVHSPPYSRLHDQRVPDEDQPTSLESQLLFQRGNQYLTLAHMHVGRALAHYEEFLALQKLQTASNPPKLEQEYRAFVQQREEVRRLAKRALKDFTAFMAALDYAHAPAGSSNGPVFQQSDRKTTQKPGDSHALVRRRPPDCTDLPQMPVHHPASLLLSATPPSDLPPFPHANSTLDSNPCHEMITYHPLLPETLHALLLAHALLQTAPTTLNRIAINAARIAHLADGYPFFLPGRSPSRADWTEVLRKTANWIHLDSAWDDLCLGAAIAAPRTAPSVSLQIESATDAALEPASSPGLGSKSALSPAASTSELTQPSTPTSTDSPAVSDEALSLASLSLQGGDVAATAEALKGPTVRHTALASSLGPNVAASDRRRKVAKDEEYLIGLTRASNVASWVLKVPMVIDTSLAGSVGTRKAGKKGKKKAGKAVVAANAGLD